MNKNNIYFSFDDGHPNDIIIANILKKNWYKNIIFYIPLNNIEGRDVMKRNDIKLLSENFEIWWHTFNHIDLTTIDIKIVKQEIMNWKKALEDIIWKKINSFCPPRWHYNNQILEVIKECWFSDCRTARLLNFNKFDRTKFLWHPNIHLYKHSLLIDLLHCIKQKDLKSLEKRLLYLKLNHIDLMDKILDDNSEVHIWWHSWEIDLKEFEYFINKLNIYLQWN